MQKSEFVLEIEALSKQEDILTAYREAKDLKSKFEEFNQEIERKAKELATQIVLRTSNTMKLEDQENSEKRIEKAIKERTASIKNEMPKILWD